VGTLVFLLSAMVLPGLFVFAVSSYSSIIQQYGYIADGSGVIRILYGVLCILAGAASTWAAVVSPVSVARKVGAAIFSVVGGGLLAFVGFGFAAGIWSASIGYVFGLLFFSAWALTRPIAGLGFLTIPILLVTSYALTLFPIGALGWEAASLVGGSLAALILAVGAWVTIAFERRRAAIRGYTIDTAVGDASWPSSARPDTAATYSLILSVLGIGLAGVIFGHIGLSRVARTGEGGRGLAIAGLVIGYLSVLAVIVYVIVFAASLAVAYTSLLNLPFGY